LEQQLLSEVSTLLLINLAAESPQQSHELPSQQTPSSQQSLPQQSLVSLLQQSLDLLEQQSLFPDSHAVFTSTADTPSDGQQLVELEQHPPVAIGACWHDELFEFIPV